MLNFDDAVFRYEPYPIGYALNVLPADLYRSLTDNYPSLDQMRKRSRLGNKYILTEHDGPLFSEFVIGHPPWREFYDYIKSTTFVPFMLDVLLKANVDLALKNLGILQYNVLKPPIRRWSSTVFDGVTQLSRLLRNGRMYLTTNFEFGAFPGDGGSQYPHTDTPSKAISLVLPIVKEGEWDAAWGGGTAVVRPKDHTKNFNYVNRYLGFDDVEVIEAFPFAPNSCVVFVKTFNSWHAVMPLRAAVSTAIRKTVVINVNISGIPGSRNGY